MQLSRFRVVCESAVNGYIFSGLYPVKRTSWKFLKEYIKLKGRGQNVTTWTLYFLSLEKVLVCCLFILVLISKIGSVICMAMIISCIRFTFTIIDINKLVGCLLWSNNFTPHIFFTEPDHHDKGKASTLNHCIRLLHDLLAQVDCLRKENSALLSESHYVRFMISLLLMPFVSFLIRDLVRITCQYNICMLLA